MSAFDNVNDSMRGYKKRQYANKHIFRLAQIENFLDLACIRLTMFWDIRNKSKGLV